MRQGSTLIETMSVLVIISLLLLISFPRAGRGRDATAVRNAREQVVSALAVARSRAIFGSRTVAVRFDTLASRVLLLAAADTELVREVGREHGVSMDASRDSIAYGPTGRGYGAANTRIILARGAAAETVTVSRLGRVRH
ncbi:MAG: GspH/FimT family pseudopilin [Gemmatimonadota bacterium]|nr:GspH/FimT family pseudopilin [Gemmatimonadota bacterium]